MKPLLDSNGLNRRPHTVAPDCWYYEEKDGLHIYFHPPGRSPTLVGIIKWRSLKASLKRKMVGSLKEKIVNGQ